MQRGDSGSYALAARAMAETARIALPTMVEGVLGRSSRAGADRRIASWSARLVRLAEMQLEVHGLERVPTSETFVVMSNHQSHYDVPVLFQTFPRTLRMVAKKELYAIPVFGRAMRAAEFIEVDRGDHARAKESLRLAAERLRSGINVWIAPEGTRSVDGSLGTFKKGGFLLAYETRTRILPVTIVGTRNVLAAHSLQIRRGQRVHVTFHAPIDPSRFGWDRRDELVDAVRRTIASALPD
jgi:1-acyl-sn-glycerol-3-phosphate acyltransferase